jgi:DNA mismatch repair protein MutL
MPSIIKLLPDALANQIAAGEVVQRPASVVKELMENALDAQAGKITLLLKDGGRTLVQVIDDGIGMTEIDARMAFERHATSKISVADDLFNIRTMGFRGEAMASIAAVAQVELKTRQQQDDLGTRILIEGSKIIAQEPCQTPVGTSVSVKGLFFNVPARKQFLKSDNRELAYAEEEFIRIALAYPEIQFSLFINDKESYRLPPGNLRQRIDNLFTRPAKLGENLIAVEEDTDIIQIKGYIGTPEVAKKSRGDQFLFVNGRFIKSHYLNHAVKSAYDDVLNEGMFPFYILFIQIDPDKIDVNVHPTKQEIKFEDERLIYNYIKVATRHALAKYFTSASLDFDRDPIFSGDFLDRQGIQNPSIQMPTFKGGQDFPDRPISSPFEKEEKEGWMSYYQELFKKEEETSSIQTDEGIITLPSQSDQSDDQGLGSTLLSEDQIATPEPYQLHHRYIIHHIRSGLIIIDQQAAHERILYERYLEWMEDDKAPIQKELFPRIVTLKGSESEILQKILPDLQRLGLLVEPFGHDEYIIHGTPSGQGMPENSETLIRDLIDQFKEELELDLSIRERTAAAMAKSTSLKRGKKLVKEEMQLLADQLFACEMPYKSPTGRKCFITLELDDLEKRFKS